jgi:trehalose 6-phosphate phosphatase
MTRGATRRGAARGAPWPSPDAEAILRTVGATHPCGLFSDVDGTISPIAATPGEARLAPGALTALTAARRRFAAVGLVSGRDPRDVWRMAPAPGLIYAGNHGFDRLTLDQQGAPRVETIPEARPWLGSIHQALDTLRAELGPTLPGAIFEDKGVTASLHVRQTADPEAAERAAIAAARRVARRYGLRVTRGRLVVELRPPIAMDKGVVIASLCREHGLRGAIYLGDDRTDMDAFRMLRRLSAESPGFHGASVAVLHDEAPPGLARAADVTVAGVAGAVALLTWLAADAGAAPT